MGDSHGQARKMPRLLSSAVTIRSHISNASGGAGGALGQWGNGSVHGSPHHFSQLSEFILLDISLLLRMPATERFSQEFEDLVLKLRAAVLGQFQEHITGCLPPCFPRQAAQVWWDQIVPILLHQDGDVLQKKARHALLKASQSSSLSSKP